MATRKIQWQADCGDQGDIGAECSQMALETIYRPLLRGHPLVLLSQLVGMGI